MSAERPATTTAAEAARIGWQLTAPLAPSDVGVRRWTWRVGDRHWLSACGETDVPALEREQALLESLVSRCDVEVPCPVAAADGHRVFRRAAGTARLTLATVHMAMVVYWLRNYWRSRDDVDAGSDRYAPLLDRQPARMSAVLAYVGA